MVAGLDHKNKNQEIAHMSTELGDGNCPEDARETVPFFTIDGSRYKVPNRHFNAIHNTTYIQFFIPELNTHNLAQENF